MPEISSTESKPDDNKKGTLGRAEGDRRGKRRDTLAQDGSRIIKAGLVPAKEENDKTKERKGRSAQSKCGVFGTTSSSYFEQFVLLLKYSCTTLTEREITGVCLFGWGGLWSFLFLFLFISLSLFSLLSSLFELELEFAISFEHSEEILPPLS